MQTIPQLSPLARRCLNLTCSPYKKQEMHLSYCLLGSDKLQRFIDDFHIQEQFDI